MSNPKFILNKKYYTVALLLGVFIFSSCTSDRIPLTTSSETAQENFLTGIEYFQKVQYTKAEPYFLEAVQADSNFALAYLYLFFCEENLAEKYQLLEKALAHSDHASKGERLLIMASDAGHSGYTKKQEGYLRELVESYPNDETAYFFLANHYFRLHEWKKSIVYLKRAIELNPQFAVAYNQLGYAYRSLEKYAAAEDAFKKYIKLNPDDPNPYDSYAELLLKMGEFDVSIETYEKALNFDPDFFPSHRGIATNYIYIKNYQQARSHLKHLLKIAQTDYQRMTAHYLLATSYAAEEDYDAALVEIDLLIELTEQNDDVPALTRHLLLKASALYENNQLTLAEKTLRKAKSLLHHSSLPQDAKENFTRGFYYHHTKILVAMKKLQEARTKAEEYLDVAEKAENPRPKKYYYSLIGMIELAAQNYQAAEQALQKSAMEDPYNRFRLAKVYLKSGEKDKAIAEFEKVMDYNGLAEMNYVIIRNRAEKYLGLLKMPG